MIELVSAERCIACDKCIRVCPTNVFDRGEDGIPVLARHGDCQTCFQCEANCPADALYVAPQTSPLPDESTVRDEDGLDRAGLLGSYRRHIGWGRGRTPGARLAVGPTLNPPGSKGSSLPITS
ncbi:ferredoxin family protein [Streptomyces decoyicus]|uniref:ferredoxin family protein n=1 Tax=Streptomyces decoyicus TaxID=249567 RepID=UPI0033B43460